MIYDTFVDLQCFRKGTYECLCVGEATVGNWTEYRDQHLPLLYRFALAHVDGGDCVFGTGLHILDCLPLSVVRHGPQQVHPLLCFDPAGKRQGRQRTAQVSFITGYDLYRGSRVSAPCVQNGPPPCVAS